MSDFEMTIGSVVGDEHQITVNKNYIIADPTANYVFKINNLNSILDAFTLVPQTMEAFFMIDNPNVRFGTIDLYDSSTGSLKSEFIVGEDDSGGSVFKITPGHTYYFYIYAQTTLPGYPQEVHRSATISFAVNYDQNELDISSELSIIRNAVFASEIRNAIIQAVSKIKEYSEIYSESLDDLLLKMSSDKYGKALRADFIKSFILLLGYDKYTIDSIETLLPEYFASVSFEYDYLNTVGLGLLKNGIYVDEVRESIAVCLHKIALDIYNFLGILNTPILSNNGLVIYNENGEAIIGKMIN